MIYSVVLDNISYVNGSELHDVKRIDFGNNFLCAISIYIVLQRKNSHVALIEGVNGELTTLSKTNWIYDYEFSGDYNKKTPLRNFINSRLEGNKNGVSYYIINNTKRVSSVSDIVSYGLQNIEKLAAVDERDNVVCHIFFTDKCNEIKLYGYNIHLNGIVSIFDYCISSKNKENTSGISYGVYIDNANYALITNDIEMSFLEVLKGKKNCKEVKIVAFYNNCIDNVLANLIVSGKGILLESNTSMDTVGELYALYAYLVKKENLKI